MKGFAVTNFGGILPIQDPKKLLDGSAEQAINSDLQGTDLRTFSPLSELAYITSTLFVHRSGFVFNDQQMFIFNQDVDATYGPVRAEEEIDNRVFLSYGFQEFPTYSTKRLGLPNADATYYGAPINWRKLGVIPGPVKPIVSVPEALNGIGHLVAGSPTVLQLDASGPLSYTPGPGDSVVTGTRIKISAAENEGWDRVNNQVYLIERAEPGEYGHLSFLTLKALDTSDLVPEGYDTATDLLNPDAPQPLQLFFSDSVNWQQEFEISQVEDRFYVYTLVTELGEEGPPSLPSVLVSVGFGQTVRVQTPTSIDDPGAIYTHKRIYRTVPTSTGEARYYFVAEIEISQELYEDSIEVIGLGEELQSLEWYPPPAELRGLVVLPNGVMAGFVDRTLYLCEPYQPHAWPAAYTKNMDNPIVGLAAFGQQLVVGTEENPYIGTASDPLSMTFSKLPTVEPCISKRAMKSLGYGVMYPSPNGLQLALPGGTKNVLKDVWDEKDWRAWFRNYSDSFAVVHDGKYYLTFFNEPTMVSKTFIFDPEAQLLRISEVTPDRCSGMLVDRDEDRLYWLADRTDLPRRPVVLEWNPDLDPESLQAEWWSQVFVMPFESNLGIMQVLYDTAWPDPEATISIEFVVDGVSQYTIDVDTAEPIRLPGGFLGWQWQIRIKTTKPIQAVFVSETVEGLRGAMSR